MEEEEEVVVDSTDDSVEQPPPEDVIVSYCVLLSLFPFSILHPNHLYVHFNTKPTKYSTTQ